VKLADDPEHPAANVS
jgi:hypothetical protein